MNKETEGEDIVTRSSLESQIKVRMDRLGASPNEKIGQHFLVDLESVNLLADSVVPGNTVIEVGAGLGQVTEALAKRGAERIVAIEIDERFKPVLSRISQDYPWVEVVISDVLAVDLKNYIPEPEKGIESGVQIVTSLPYHITEPFLNLVAGLPLESINMIVGLRLARAATLEKDSGIGFGKLTLLSQTFFDVRVIKELGKDCFYPPPRTRSAILQLTPREEQEFRNNKRLYLLRRLFETEKRSPLVKNCLKEGIIEFELLASVSTLSKEESSRRSRREMRRSFRNMIKRKDFSSEEETDVSVMTQNQAREIVSQLGISESILSKPFSQLNNNELQKLSKALR
jgi:16S rRNA (adenine1518-N6/adenine1519-N6)-dimethyltransferase